MTDVVAYGPHDQQFGELNLPDGHDQRPLVILIHGGFWRDQYHLDLMYPLVTALHERGYATWNIEYRRVGPTGGGYPTTLDDVAAAVDAFAHDQWAQTAVIGHSAGGHLALWNASRTTAAVRPDLTVGLAPVADVISANRNRVGVDATANFFGGTVDDVPDHYHAGQPQPKEFAGRVVLIHGDADESVPLEQSTNLAGQVDRIEVFTGVNHFDVIDPDHACWQVVFDELAELAPTEVALEGQAPLD